MCKDNSMNNISRRKEHFDPVLAKQTETTDVSQKPLTCVQNYSTHLNLTLWAMTRNLWIIFSVQLLLPVQMSTN